jgi:G3E family GTPase
MSEITIETRQRLGQLINKKRNLREELTKTETEIDNEVLKILGKSILEEPEAVNKSNFNLTYTPHESDKLKNFEVADQKDNDPEKFQRAINILKQNNSTISNRYHGSNYEFGYWEYRNRIYRQKLKT